MSTKSSGTPGTAAFRLFCGLLTSLCFAFQSNAECHGQNQLAALAPETLASLTAAVDAAPYARGNFWRATRGDQVLTVIGTFHLDDPRHDHTMMRLGPLIDVAATVLVEAGPVEEAALKQALARDPSLMFITDGPTLPETLPAATWDQLKTALRARSIPPFMGAKMQPAYLSLLLGIPPCASEMFTGTPNGLDQRIIARAAAAGVPLRALEPYDTVFSIFGAMTAEESRQMLELSLAMDARSEDAFATMLQSYFDEDSRMIWEYSRWQTLNTGGMDPARVNADFATMENSMVLSRNRAWIPVIEKALNDGPVVAAFGALHLSGQDGVLSLLKQNGFTLERLVF